MYFYLSLSLSLNAPKGCPVTRAVLEDESILVGLALSAPRDTCGPRNPQPRRPMQVVGSVYLIPTRRSGQGALLLLFAIVINQAAGTRRRQKASPLRSPCCPGPS